MLWCLIVATPTLNNKMADDMKLYVHSGDEYSSSIDPESLQVLTYLRLLKVAPEKVQIIRTCKPWSSPSGCFPTLTVNGKVYVGSDRIIKELKKLGLELDEKGLSEREAADVAAFIALLKDRLKLALLYLHWMDSRNYTDVTRQWFGKMASFPIPLYLLSRQHRCVQFELNTQLPEESSLEHRGVLLINGAEECLKMLSVKLKERKFFGGDNPSTLDAFVFGYLKIIYQYQLPGNNKLQLQLNSLSNLSGYCDRMRGIAFPEIKTRLVTGVNTPSGPLWKDPTVWACAALGGALLIVQGVRVGLFTRLATQLGVAKWSQQITNHESTEELD